MKRCGFSKILYVIFISALLAVPSGSAFADTAETSFSTTSGGRPAPPGCPPAITDSFYICTGETIYDTVVVDGNLNHPEVSFSILVGPGDLVVDNPVADSIHGYYSYTPPSADSYDVVYVKYLPGDDSVLYSYTYVVFMSDQPVIADQDFAVNACDLGEPRILTIEATGGDLTYVLVSGPGSIDLVTGILSYTPDTSGVFTFEVEVSNSCGTVSALITDTVILNTPPQVFCSDTTVYLCDVEEICFDVLASDPDGDSVMIFMLEGLGEFTQTGPVSGYTCFVPADLDSSTYQFVYHAADSCSCTICDDPVASPTPPDCCQDTALVTVIINQAPVIECPEPQEFFTCEGGEFCFDIVATDPDNDQLTFNILSGNATNRFRSK